MRFFRAIEIRYRNADRVSADHAQGLGHPIPSDIPGDRIGYIPQDSNEFIAEDVFLKSHAPLDAPEHSEDEFDDLHYLLRCFETHDLYGAGLAFRFIANYLARAMKSHPEDLKYILLKLREARDAASHYLPL